MTQVNELLKNVEKNSNTKLLIFMSWQAPRHKASLKADSFSEFVELAKSSLSAKFKAQHINGQYQGIKEESAMLLVEGLDVSEALTLVDEAVKLGNLLGQDSILVSSVKSSHLYNCQSGHVDATGQGYEILPNEIADDYSVLNGIKFRLNLSF
jgi:hypothetical protein